MKGRKFYSARRKLSQCIAIRAFAPQIFALLAPKIIGSNVFLTIPVILYKYAKLTRISRKQVDSKIQQVYYYYYITHL